MCHIVATSSFTGWCGLSPFIKGWSWGRFRATALGSYAFEQFRADPPLHLKALLRLLGIANAKQRKALCFACDWWPSCHLWTLCPGFGFPTFQLGAINDSEAFCRDLKGKFAALAKNSVDYVARVLGKLQFFWLETFQINDVLIRDEVMIRLLTTVDDTVMLSKSMVAEWLQAPKVFHLPSSNLLRKQWSGHGGSMLWQIWSQSSSPGSVELTDGPWDQGVMLDFSSLSIRTAFLRGLQKDKLQSGISMAAAARSPDCQASV